MSHYMTALAMKQQGLKPAAKIVLYWLADHYNGETGECFPSHKRLAEVCEMTDRSVRNQIEVLKDMGLIEVFDRKRPNGSQTSNAYKLLLKEECGGKNIPTPSENISTHPMKNFPTHNLVNNNLGKELNILVNDRFDEFWMIYPRKVAKGNAQKAWAKAVKRASVEEILAGARRYAEARQGQDNQFTAHPASWLNGDRWADDFNAIKPQEEKRNGKKDGDAAEFARRAGERWATRRLDSGSDQDITGSLFPNGEPLRIGGGSD